MAIRFRKEDVKQKKIKKAAKAKEKEEERINQTMDDRWVEESY